MRLNKSISFSECDLKFSSDGVGTFEGYASVFGGVDSYGDTIVRGAFDSTLRKNGLPKMFFQHDWKMPIGKWTSAKEDEKGLYVKGELTPGLQLADSVHAALKHGTLDGLSIGGFIKQGDYETTENGRVIRKWSNLIEVSPVVFPADSAARIDAETVKTSDVLDAIQEIESVRDFEQFLRDAGGLSKAAAVSVIAKAKKVFEAGEPLTSDDEREILERIHRITKS